MNIEEGCGFRAALSLYAILVNTRPTDEISYGILDIIDATSSTLDVVINGKDHSWNRHTIVTFNHLGSTGVIDPIFQEVFPTLDSYFEELKIQRENAGYAYSSWSTYITENYSEKSSQFIAGMCNEILKHPTLDSGFASLIRRGEHFMELSQFWIEVYMFLECNNYADNTLAALNEINPPYKVSTEAQKKAQPYVTTICKFMETECECREMTGSLIELMMYAGIKEVHFDQQAHCIQELLDSINMTLDTFSFDPKNLPFSGRGKS
jgi:hypothetical protein